MSFERGKWIMNKNQIVVYDGRTEGMWDGDDDGEHEEGKEIDKLFFFILDVIMSHNECVCVGAVAGGKFLFLFQFSHNHSHRERKR